jgi:serine/threonine-protein kinase
MTPADALVGRTLAGKYVLVEKLGAGAMGAVYKALEAGAPAGAFCAVKVMEASAVGDPALRERFEREAKALFALRHPHVLEVRDYGVDAGLPYLVMELLQGRSLEEMVVEHTPDPQTGVELAKDVLRGLAFAHGKGVLHRDLKSENIWVSWDGQKWRAKLLDFGLVKFEDDQKWGAGKKLTMQGSVFGSPAYMSPEQATGQPLDARADVYSAGIVLYELLTGSWPFEAESQMDMMRMHLLEAPPALTSKREHLTVRPELEEVVKKALAKKKDQRFPSAVEMLAALEAVPTPGAWLAGAAQPAAPAPPPIAAPSPAAAPPPAVAMQEAKGGGNTVIWVGIALLLLFGLLAGGGAAAYFLLVS